MIENNKRELINNELAEDTNNLVISNSLLAYIKEITKFPLLSPEEEVNCGKMLQNKENNKLLITDEVDVYDVPILNESLLFNSLCNNNSYKTIIENLISFYNRLNNKNSYEIEKLKKYQAESNKLNRALNHAELKRLFNINIIDSTLNEKELFLEIKKFMGYKYAFNKMFVSNLKLVVSIAKNYKCDIDIMDLISEGNLGLMKAVSRFDVSLGNRFSTYAVYWIKMSIRRAIYNQSSSVIIPEHKQKGTNAFIKKIDRLEQQEKRTLNIFEIAEKLSMSIEEISEYQKYIEREVSLDDTINEAEDMTLKDVISSDFDVEGIILKESLANEIEDLFTVLTEREKMIIQMRFGFGEYKGHNFTFQSIGEILSISQQRVRQIEQFALLKMKNLIKRDEKVFALSKYIYR